MFNYKYNIQYLPYDIILIIINNFNIINIKILLLSNKYFKNFIEDNKIVYKLFLENNFSDFIIEKYGENILKKIILLQRNNCFLCEEDINLFDNYYIILCNSLINNIKLIPENILKKSKVILYPVFHYKCINGIINNVSNNSNIINIQCPLCNKYEMGVKYRYINYSID